MRLVILSFVVGVWLLQQQAALPELQWAWGLLLPLSAVFLRGATGDYPRKILLPIFFLGAGFFWAAAMAEWRLAEALPAEWEGKDIQVIGVVAGLPQTTAMGTRFEFDVEQVLTAAASGIVELPEHISLMWYPESDKSSQKNTSKNAAENGDAKNAAPSLSVAPTVAIGAGERWQLTVRLKKPHGSSNPHGFDFEAWALERNIRATGYVRAGSASLPASLPVRLDAAVYFPDYWIARLRQNVRARFLAALPRTDNEGEQIGVLVALAVGDQRAIPRDAWQVFTRTGINHLMSISGLHITMVSGLMFALVSLLWRKSVRLTLRLPARKAAVVAGFAAALGYALLAGFAVPAQRTVMMLAVVAAALWMGRRLVPTTVLVWALFVVVLFDPWAVLSAGFWLSFGAIALIMLVTNGRIGHEHWLVAWGRVQWAMTLGLIPPLLALFQQVSLVSPLANALAVPLVSFVVVPLTLLATLPPLEFLLWPADAVMRVTMIALQWLSDLPNSVWSQHAPPAWTLAVAVAGIAWMLTPKGFPAKWLGAILLLPMFLVMPPRPPAGELWLTVLDVGQGLAVVARTQNHALLYDTGPGYSSDADSGNRIIVPFLRGEGIRQLDGMIVTHDDIDHSGGAMSVMEAVPVMWLASSLVNESLVNEQLSGLPDKPHPILAAASDNNPRRCVAGDAWEWDDVRFDMLHPQARSYDDTKVKNNALGCVLKITTPHGSVLLPTDIEKDSEAELLKRAAAHLPATVLIVPHHGSKTSSTEAFLRQVDPKISIFTVGYRNRFRHPNEQVWARYQERGGEIYRSDRDGAVTLRFGAEHGDKPQATTHRDIKRRYWHERGVGELKEN